MKVVLDTNVLLQAIARNSRLRPIWTAFLSEKLELYVTSAILLEYEELIGQKTSFEVAQSILTLIDRAPNAHFIATYYEWAAITTDYDDNKFFDAAVSATADYLVTNDTHFNQAKKLPFPKMNIIPADEFLSLLQSMAL